MFLTRADIRLCLLAVLGLSGLFTVPSLSAQPTDKDCQCRAPGGAMRDLGTVECVDIAGNNKLLLCTMSTNTPYWKEVENVKGCPTA